MSATLAICGGIVALIALLVLRAVVLARSRGNVLCRLRHGVSGWKNGVARYADGELHWLPFLSLRLRPRHAIARRGLRVSPRRREGELWAVDCGAITLAMSEDALTGFLAWLESAPPGAHLDLT
ncbi:DUF2550 domain-containing protein [Spongiactinospora sp. TRM90649]|uniref:DUF2550 domain-containing protein n=1 Tax=Spongiactinospora sp. TRM90649 TaxID=3031114 RepID=UPI0023F8F2AB|nr:DUF2550 domain-containing protein [Spongiactinospora sp. TRM90649]MDF5752553.1 DUF2550 domain-containing protein [Spongiactinospora sp. TRM90649]